MPDAPTTPFDNFDLQKAERVVTLAAPDNFKVTEAFYEGDHWQDGDGWIGPRPDLDSDDLVEDVMANIEKGFVSKNVIREMVKRHVRGVAGRAPVWSFDVRRSLPPGEQRTEEENKLVTEVADAIDKWYKKRRVHQRVKDIASVACRAGRGVFRLYIPSGKTGEFDANGVKFRGIPVPKTLDEALEYIFIDTPSPDSATLYTDPATMEDVGVYIYKPIDPNTLQPTGRKVVELSYLDGSHPIADSKTRIKRIEENGKDTPDSVDLDFGGRLSIIEVNRGEPLIDEQIRQTQRALNLALSMLPRTMVTAGFLERIFFDAQMPGEWEYDSDGARVPGSFKAGKYYTGAGATAFMQGTQYTPKEGEESLKDPNVVFREPIDPNGCIKAAQFHYLTLLEMGNQAHIVLTGEAIVSGKSREQARADYENSLQDSKEPIEEGTAQLLDTVVAMAEALMNKPGLYSDKFRAVFTCHIYTGPISFEERRQNDDSVKVGTMSIVDAIQASGNPDPDATIAQIAAEKKTGIQYLLNLADAFQKLSSGMPAEVAAEILGIDPKIIAKISGALKAEALANQPTGSNNVTQQ